MNQACFGVFPLVASKVFLVVQRMVRSEFKFYIRYFSVGIISFLCTLTLIVTVISF